MPKFRTLHNHAKQQATAFPLADPVFGQDGLDQEAPPRGGDGQGRGPSVHQPQDARDEARLHAHVLGWVRRRIRLEPVPLQGSQRLRERGPHEEGPLVRGLEEDVRGHQVLDAEQPVGVNAG